MTGLGNFVDDSEEVLQITSLEYTEEHGDPIVHLFCRTRDREKRHVEVEGHRPSFYVRDEAATRRISNHDWVEGIDRGYVSIHGDDLSRIECTLPKHVGGGHDIGQPLRDYFDETWEADVWYTNRFLLDTGIGMHVRVDRTEAQTDYVSGDYRVHVDQVEPAEPDWRVRPRICTADIEVLSPDGFPDPGDAEQPVTAITLHDSHENEYSVFLLRCDDWDASDREVANDCVRGLPDGAALGPQGVRVFDDESALLDACNRRIASLSPDLLSGWNSSATDRGDAFDYPYLINRCKALNVLSYRDWSPMGQVWTSRRGNGDLQPASKGVVFFDMLQAYKKVRWSKPNGGYSLDNIASIELGDEAGKLDIEEAVEADTDDATAIDAAWRTDPALFVRYNVKDVAATTGIDGANGVVDMYQDLRALTGAQYGDCHNNIDLLDLFVLRYAKNAGIALPTNEEPKRDWYYGARVFEPELGRHEHVVYPDLWSMYPNMIRNCNMSPETLVGTETDLAASEYDESDCRWSYVDTRRDEVKRETEPEYEKLYFLKPEVKQGFTSTVVDDLMDLKDEYDGTTLYDAVKRVVNSVYGVFGDSNSYGKGYRLFEWRMAEAITLGGRKMIQDTAERFVDDVDAVRDGRGLDGQAPYLVGGDTDSAMCAMPFLDTDEQELALDIAQDAAERVNEWYDGWACDTLNVPHGEHYCQLEIESYAPRAFVPEGVTKKKAKKRYAEVIAWDEGDWVNGDETLPAWLLDEVPDATAGEFSVTGIDVVRSDRAPATREIVQKVLEVILRVDDRATAQRVAYGVVSDAVEEVENGDRGLGFVARPKGMSKQPHEYGSTSQTPMPTYRGAKYVDQHFEWENMARASKPLLLYVDTVRGDWPRTYTASTAEDGREVDAIAVTEPERVPDGFEIDMDKQVEKVLRDPMEPILAPMSWSFDDAISDTQQSDMSAFM